MATIKVALLGGNEAELDTADGGVALTVLGVTELRRPTLAARIRRRLLEERAGVRRPGRRTWIVTVVGMTTVRAPSLATELIELAQLRDSGMATAEEIHRTGQRILAQEQGPGGLSFVSILGATHPVVASDEAERHAIHEAVLSGLLPARVREALRGTEGIAAQARPLALALGFPALVESPSPYRGLLPPADEDDAPASDPPGPPGRPPGLSDPVGGSS